MRPRTSARVILVLAFVTVTACADGGGSAAGPTPPAAPTSCDRADLPLAEPDIGVLVVGTSVPLEEPWFEDGDPTTGRGFESALSYEVAEELGFGPDEVAWLIVDRETMLAPGEKEFDLAVDRVTTDEVGEGPELTLGYLELPTTVVALDPSTGSEDTATLRVGAVAGTGEAQDLEAIAGDDVAIFPDLDTALGAAEDGQVDALALDPRRVVEAGSAELAVIGRIPSDDDVTRSHFVVEAGNPIRPCIDAAIDTLRQEGRLDALVERWLPTIADVPELDLGQAD